MTPQILYNYCDACGYAVRYPVGLFQRCPKCKHSPLTPYEGDAVLPVEQEDAPVESALAVEVSETIETEDIFGGVT